MSDSKRDLTRIEDLGEFLHELSDEEDYLPEIPNESEPPTFMEETLISEDSFSSGENTSAGFESDISSIEGDDVDFSSEEPFDTSVGFETSNFGESTDFSSESSFDSGNDFAANTDFTSAAVSFEESSDFEGTASFQTPDDFSFDSEQDIAVEEVATEEGPEASDEDLFSHDLEQEDIAKPLDDLAMDIVEPELHKTPLPQMEASLPYQDPENFEDLKKFAENSSFTGMASEGNPSFSVLLKEIKYLEDAQDILTLLKELKLAMDSDEVLINRLTRGEFLIPRISEFAATLLAHKLRRFDIDILVGLSDEIHPPKHMEVPEIGLVSKQSLYQNQAHHFQFDETNLDISQIIVSATPTLDGYQVLKYVGVASEHKMLEAHLVEDENSLEMNSHYQELAQKLKAHALKSHANAVVGLNYQLTPLPSNFGTSHTRYRLTCTGNLVWINRI